MSDEDLTWVRAASLAELGEGEMTAIEVNDRSIAIYRLEGGEEVFATDNICTHALAFLTEGWLEGDIVECPLHGGCFNVRTGAGQGDPITRDLATYAVRVQDGEILVGIPEVVPG